jgi:hypothetical protein
MHDRAYYMRRIHQRPILKVLYYTGAARFWKDGDGVAAQFRYWHPLGILFAFGLTVALLVLAGFTGVLEDGHNIGLWPSPYWKERREQREFL